MDSPFLHFIDSIVRLPDVQKDKFKTLISERRLLKNENYINAGERPSTMAFVKKGLFRYFYANQEGEEFTKAFFQENSLLISYSAIVADRPSHFSIQALEDAEIEIVDYQKLQALFDEQAGWHKLLSIMLQKAFIIKEERERQFLLYNAQERYASFLRQFPSLDKRIKQHLIASYLRITPESLSRIRRKMKLLS